MKLRYAFLALLFAPGVAFAQLVNPEPLIVDGDTLVAEDQPFYPQLDITAPASLVATVSNFRPEELPNPPYNPPDPATILYIGSSVFAEVVDGDSVSRGTAYTLAGVTADLAIALDAGGNLAYGCDGSAADGGPSDIANGPDLVGKIVLIQRGPVPPATGACGFSVKAQRAEAEGAAGVLIYNNAARDPDTAPNQAWTAGTGTIGVPTASLPFAIAQTLIDAISGGETVTATLRCDEVYEGQVEGGVCSPPTAGEGGPSVAGAGLFLAGQNPTSTTARLVVRTPAAENVTVIAYNMLGQEVARLYSGAVLGEQVVTLQAGNLPAGSYFVRATGETFTQTQQVTVVR